MSKHGFIVYKWTGCWIRHMNYRFHINRGALWKSSENGTSPNIALGTQIPKWNWTKLTHPYSKRFLSYSQCLLYLNQICYQKPTLYNKIGYFLGNSALILLMVKSEINISFACYGILFYYCPQVIVPWLKYTRCSISYHTGHSLIECDHANCYTVLHQNYYVNKHLYP